MGAASTRLLGPGPLHIQTWALAPPPSLQNPLLCQRLCLPGISSVAFVTSTPDIIVMAAYPAPPLGAWGPTLPGTCGSQLLRGPAAPAHPARVGAHNYTAGTRQVPCKIAGPQRPALSSALQSTVKLPGAGPWSAGRRWGTVTHTDSSPAQPGQDKAVPAGAAWPAGMGSGIHYRPGRALGFNGGEGRRPALAGMPGQGQEAGMPAPCSSHRRADGRGSCKPTCKHARQQVRAGCSPWP